MCHFFAAMTSYSPGALAMNDMLRQQLALTKQFVESSKRLHQSLVSSIEPTHHYTTLKETKKVLVLHYYYYMYLSLTPLSTTIIFFIVFHYK